MEIALVGNTNCGKTTVFNKLTRSCETVGNRASVTVGVAKKRLSDGTTIADLPGIFSLNAFSPDEKCAVNYLRETPPDALVFVADSTLPYRSLRLLVEVIELKIPTVLLLNKSDLLFRYGGKVNVSGLSEALGVPVVLSSGKSGRGLMSALSEAKTATCPKIQPLTADELSERFFTQPDIYSQTLAFDKLLTSRFFSIPIFLVIMSVAFFLAFRLPTLIFDDAFFTAEIPLSVKNLFLYFNINGFFSELICDGIVPAVCSVLSFIPQLFTLYFIVSFLDSCGYLSRVSFIFDRLTRFFGLNGSAVVSFILGCGCSCTGVMSCRSEKSPCKRRLAIIGVPFVPCGAKLPVISLIGGYCFNSAWEVAVICYIVGIFSALLSALLLSGLRPFCSDSDFSLSELPRYELPDFSHLFKASAVRISSFFSRAVIVTALCGSILWLLSSYGLYGKTSDISQSFLRYGAEFFSSVFEPLGFGNWKPTVATLIGHIAKEQIVGFFGVVGLENAFSGTLSAFSFLFFNLLCVPCATAVTAIHKELGSFKMTAFALIYHTAFAYAFSFAFYQLGLFFEQGRLSLKAATAFILPVLIFFLLFRRLTARRRDVTINQR